MSDDPRGTPPRSGAPRLSAERWARLEPLVDEALDLPALRRREYFDQLATSDPMLAADVERLVSQSERDGSLLERGAAERRSMLGGVDDDSLDVNLRAQLEQSLGGGFIIEREMGGGGMSRVFLADEPRLGRKVVIKVLAPELAAGLSSERFEREIRIIASLQQANIVPLLSAGRTQSLPYYTMPLVDGRSLRERLAQGPLPIGEAVNVLRDVARALAYAHERGVVHRDIKPGNVLLSGGAAVVSDFGIAKALRAARTDLSQPSPTLTLTGMGIGTPTYMSPEQAAGDPDTDHRTDIYALGCLAYEILTGKPPFQSQRAHEIVAAHFQETPRPIAEGRPDIPPALAVLITQCLQKDPARRPQTAADVLQSLDAVVARPGSSTRATVRRDWVIGLALAAAVVVGGVFLVRGVRASGGARDEQPVYFAVLPFRNVGGDTALEYRADGLSDELLTAMGKVRGVKVTGRTAAQRYQGKTGLDLRLVERDLGTRLLVTGTVRESGGRLVVSAQLNDSSVSGELWADTFERSSRDFGTLSDDIARVITDTLRVRFGARIGTRGHTAPTAGTSNTEALELYLLGQELVKHRGADIPRGAAKFESAIAKDSNFARAWAALAKTLNYYPYFVGTPFSELRDSVRKVARHALAIDSTLADAHIALAVTVSMNDDWSSAVVEFRRAIALEPDNFDAHFTFGRLLMCRGETDAALAEFAEAGKLERLSALVSSWVAFGLYASGRADSALIESARAVQLDSTLLPTTSLGSIVAAATGHADVARRLIRVEAPVGAMSTAAYVYALLGDTATALRLVRRAESATPRPWFADVMRAMMLLAGRDTAAALTALERSAAASGGNWISYSPITTPAYDAIRQSPRFIALERHAGLDERVINSPRGGRR